MSPSESRKQKLQMFLEDTNEKTFATIVRQFVKESIMMTLKVDENRFMPDKMVISEGYHFLNEFCDIIDPDIANEETSLSEL